MSRAWPLVALAAVPVLAISGCLGLVLFTPPPTPPALSCGPTGAAATVDVAAVPAGPVAGYRGQQLVNAAHIVNAALALGLDAKAQTIGVMTAMGESSLKVLDRGDAVGPDSRGLFQQRAVGWGSYEERMDPFASATSFYRALVSVPGWDTLAPTIAAHRTQRNADPYHYEKHWPAAVQVVEALAQAAGAPAVVVGAAPTAAAPQACVVPAVAGVAAEGWTKPTVGPVTSNFGMRRHPVTGAPKMHAGTDVGADCGTPIFAAAAGRVVGAGPARGYGNLITVDHGGGVTSRYAHMYSDGVLTQVGATVSAGQQIATVGSSGTSTGCHLHFEVRQGEEFVDPAAFMVQQGAPIA